MSEVAKKYYNLIKGYPGAQDHTIKEIEDILQEAYVIDRFISYQKRLLNDYELTLNQLENRLIHIWESIG